MSTEGAVPTPAEREEDGDAAEGVAEQSPDDQPTNGSGSTETGEEIGSIRTRLKWELPLILLILAGVDISIDGALLFIPLVEAFSSEALVPVQIYMAGFLGAGAYIVTSLIFSPKDRKYDVFQLGYRLVGALPLAAGVYLLSGAFVDVSQTSIPYTVVGLAFLAGLYVKLSLRRLGQVAERLSGTEEEAQLPYESGSYRMEATTQLRRGWQRVALGNGPEQDRTQAKELLQEAETILDDEDAPPEELIHARNLGEEAVQLLEDGSETTIDGVNGDGDSSDVSENGESRDGQPSTQ